MEAVAGLQLAINSTLLTTKNMTAISGANPAVATLEASHGIAALEFGVVLSSGWGGIKNRIFRASSVVTNDVTLEGFDCSNATFFPSPPTTGAGTVAEIDATTWKTLTKILLDQLESSGGERQFETLTPNELNGEQIEHPTTRTPFRYTLPFGENAVAESWYSTALAASRNGTLVAFRMLYPSGLKIFSYCKIDLQETPNQQALNVPKSRLVLLRQGPVTRYST
jgi:hypothetical protein